LGNSAGAPYSSRAAQGTTGRANGYIAGAIEYAEKLIEISSDNLEAARILLELKEDINQ